MVLVNKYTQKMHIGYILRMNLLSLCMYMIVIGFSKYHQLSEVITMLHIAFKNALLFFFFFFQSTYLFLAALGLHCCVPAFCCCGKQELL